MNLSMKIEITNYRDEEDARDCIVEVCDAKLVLEMVNPLLSSKTSNPSMKAFPNSHYSLYE